MHYSVVGTLYVLVAGIFSAFYGLNATHIFLVELPKKTTWGWWLHQFWLNFRLCRKSEKALN